MWLRLRPLVSISTIIFGMLSSPSVCLTLFYLSSTGPGNYKSPVPLLFGSSLPVNPSTFRSLCVGPSVHFFVAVPFPILVATVWLLEDTPSTSSLVISVLVPSMVPGTVLVKVVSPHSVLSYTCVVPDFYTSLSTTPSSTLSTGFFWKTSTLSETFASSSPFFTTTFLLPCPTPLQLIHSHWL